MKIHHLVYILGLEPVNGLHRQTYHLDILLTGKLIWTLVFGSYPVLFTLELQGHLIKELENSLISYPSRSLAQHVVCQEFCI